MGKGDKECGVRPELSIAITLLGRGSFCGLWHVYCLSCLFALALGDICRLCSVTVALPGHLLCSDLD